MSYLLTRLTITPFIAQQFAVRTGDDHFERRQELRCTSTNIMVYFVLEFVLLQELLKQYLLFSR